MVSAGRNLVALDFYNYFFSSFKPQNSLSATAMWQHGYMTIFCCWQGRYPAQKKIQW